MPVNNEVFQGFQLEPVDGGEAGRVSRNDDADTDAAPSPAKRGGSSWFFCCAKKEGEGSCATTLFTYYTYATTLLDIVDGGFDYAQVAELAQHQDTRKHAKLLGVCTTIALLLELLLKTKMRRRKDKNTAEGNEGLGDGWDMNVKSDRDAYIFLSGLMELIIFCVEDATTVFVWWQTGTYDSTSTIARANLITTVVSAVGAAIALLYGMIRTVRAGQGAPDRTGRPGSDGCTDEAWHFGIVAALFVATLAFWAVVALYTIQGGDSYDCIGSCAVNANATATTTTLLAGSDALVFDGSNSSFGSGESGAGEGGKDVGLNRAAIGMYVVGWIVAVMGGFFAIAASFI